MVNKINKVITVLIVIGILISSSLNIYADHNDVEITTLNLLPVRETFENLGFKVVWIQSSKDIRIYNDAYEYNFIPNQNNNFRYFLIDGVSYVKPDVLNEFDLKYQILKNDRMSIVKENISKKYNVAPTINDTRFKPNELERLNKKNNKLLFFWATWCPYCTDYIKDLKNMDLELLDIDIIGVNLDTKDTLDDVQNLLQSNKRHFTNIMDTEKYIYNLYQPKVIPTTYLINKDNIIIETIEGSIKEDDIIKLFNLQ